MATSKTNRRMAHFSGSDSDPSLRLFVSILTQWWKILLPATLVLLVLSLGLVMWSFSPKYRATAWLQVKGVQPYVAFPDQEAADRDSNKKFVHTQVELIRSPVILGRVLSQPDIARIPEVRNRRDPVDWLSRRGLIIVPKGESELLEIAYEGADPESAAKLVNAVVDAYFTMRQEKRGGHSQSVMMLLQDERARRAEEIKSLQSEVRQLQKQLVAKDPTIGATALMGSDVILSESPLKNVQENLAKAEVDLKVLTAQVQALEDSVLEAAKVPDVLIEREITDREEVQQVLVALNQKRAMRDRVRVASNLGETDPRYRKLTTDIHLLEESLQALRDANRPRIREEMKAFAGLQRQQELAELKTQLETQKLIVQSMRANYDAMVSNMSQSGGQTLDLKFKQAELSRKQLVFDSISQRAAQIGTEMYAPSRVELVQQATSPKVPIEMLPWKMLIVAAFASLCLPFGICAIWERSVRRVTSVDQLQADGNLQVVGEIACLPEKKNVAGQQQTNLTQMGLFEESIDSLRTGLVLSQADERIQVLVVSSAVSGEGKTSVASQLAVSLARASGMPTLLIDGDMRSPDLHHIFQVQGDPGLAEVLGDRCELESAINRDWSEHVHILPAGKMNKSPHKLVGSSRFKQLLNDARANYRYVIVDTPPILAASESLVMARDADATLVCAMRDISRESHVRMSYQRLLSVGVTPVGTVLNGVPLRQYARRYGSYTYANSPSES